MNLLGELCGGKILVFSGSDIKNLEMMIDEKDEDDIEKEKEKGYNKNLERGGKKISKLGIDIIIQMDLYIFIKILILIYTIKIYIIK